MSAFSAAVETAILGHMLGSTTWAKPAARWVALHLADPTDAALAATEVAGSGYARVQHADPFAVSGKTATNTLALQFPVALGDWGLISHASVWSASTGGTMLAHGPLEVPRSVLIGDILSYAAGKLSLTVD